MLRFIFASVAILTLCNCDALWQGYEVPCERGFICPDASISPVADMTGQHTDSDGSTTGQDGSTTGHDGSTGTGDMGTTPPGDMGVKPPDSGGSPSDLATSPPDILTPSDMLVTKNDAGTVVVSDLSLAVKGDTGGRAAHGQAVVPAGKAKR